MADRSTALFVQVRDTVLVACAASLLFGSLDALAGFSLGGWELKVEAHLVAQAWAIASAFFFLLALLAGVCGRLIIRGRDQGDQLHEVQAMIIWLSLGISYVVRLVLYLSGNQRDAFYQDVALVAGTTVLAACVQGAVWRYVFSRPSMRLDSAKAMDRMLTTAVFPCLILTLAGWWSASHSRRPGTDVASLFALVAAFGLFWGIGRLYRSKHRSRLRLAMGLALGVLWVLPVLRAPLPYIDRENGERPSFQGTIPRVLLITIDTLRADALGSYNGGTHPTPNLDRLAESGTRFSRAVSCAPWTLPSMISLMTGLPVSIHNVRTFEATLPGGRSNLAEHFQAAGYATGAIGDNAFLRPGRGFENGFEHYNIFPRDPGGNADNLPRSIGARLLTYVLSLKPVTNITTTRLVDLSLDWLNDHRDTPFFFWVHIFDPHVPYAPPQRFYPPGDPPGDLGYDVGLNDQINRGLVVLNEAEKEWLKELYLAEVRYVDEEIGRLLETVNSFGPAEDTLIILTSDHGEEFFEHGQVDHGHSVYQELIHVPLIVSLPGRVPSGVREDWVSGESVYGTSLDLAGLPFESHMPGQQALFNPERVEGPESRPVFAGATMAHFVSQDTVIHDTWKLLRSATDDSPQLFNLRDDPLETEDLFERNPGEAERLRGELTQWRDDADRLIEELHLSTGGAIEIPEATVEVLLDLGYLR